MLFQNATLTLDDLECHWQPARSAIPATAGLIVSNIMIVHKTFVHGPLAPLLFHYADIIRNTMLI